MPTSELRRILVQRLQKSIEEDHFRVSETVRKFRHLALIKLATEIPFNA